MKYLLKLILLNLILISKCANALNVVEGWYGGMTLGASTQPEVSYSYESFNFINNNQVIYTPDANGAQITINYNPITNPTTQPGKLTFDVFGNIGLMAGYRFYSGFRAELELNYTYVPFQRLLIGVDPQLFATDTFTNVTVNDTVTVRSPSHSTGIKMEGSTSSGFVFINGIYEYIQRDCEYNWVPYLGLGLGYGVINNSAKLFDNEFDVDRGNASINTLTPMAQAIIGISYFLDDFSAFAFDVRYKISGQKVKYLTPTYPGIPGEYLDPDLPGSQPADIILRQETGIGFSQILQIFSFNLTFTGAFNCF